jgi:hypothetical protein
MFDMTIGFLMALPCKQKRIASAVGGAAVAYMGLDTVLPIPRAAHYALGGIAVDAACRGGDVMSGGQELMISGALGYAGAVAAGMLLR